MIHLPDSEQLVIPGIGESLKDKEERAIELLRLYEKNALDINEQDGYYLAFSGGKDSVVIEHLAKKAGIKFKPFYNQTTIDPPELIHFIKNQYAYVSWNRPKRNFFKAMIDSHGMPSRRFRWCCEEYKECGGDGQVKILGVRAAESVRRKKNWKPVTLWRSTQGGFAVNPILYWSDDDVWRYIKINGIPYCSLYNEGFNRLGCIGCPMAGEYRRVEFARWPGFEKAWKRGCRMYYERRKGQLNSQGEPYCVEQFPTWQDFWNWWITEEPMPDEEWDCLGLYDAQ